MSPKKLYHSVSRIVARPSTIRGRMIDDPSLRAIGALEEPVVSRSIISICRAQHTSVSFGPCALLRWVRSTVPLEQAQAIICSPAIRCGVCDVGRSSVVQSDRSFVDGCAALFPRLSWLGDHIDATGERHIVGSQFLETDGLICHSMEAGKHQIVAIVIEPEDGRVD